MSREKEEKPIDVELRYWPRNKPVPEGWVKHDGLVGTHHGNYSTILVRNTKNGE